LILASSIFMLLLAAQPTNAQFTVSVFPSIGPNGNGSPSIFTYGANAISALETGATHAGTPNTPGYYSQLPAGATISPTQIIATGGSGPTSWNGVANPSGAFANEVGNALFFGMHFSANPATVPTALTYNVSVPGLPASVAAGFNGALSGNLATRNYSPFLVGYNKNTNTFFTSGPISGAGAPAVTDIYYAGPSGAFAPTVSGPLGLSAAITALLAAFPSPNGTVPVGGGTFNFNGTNITTANNAAIGAPEPASMAVLALGVVGLLGYTYNRRRRAAILSTAC
jgi:hypothetical protein